MFRGFNEELIFDEADLALYISINSKFGIKN
jgi:hypothetical protein